MRLFVSALLLLNVGVIGSARGQAQAVPREVPKHFDVASVRPNQVGGDSRRVSSLPGGGFIATSASLRLLIARAFGVAEAQISGGPNWIDSDTFDISAKVNTPLELTPEELRPLLQALLAERFHLIVHQEMKEASVYSLTVAKNGPKLTEHKGSGSPGISASSDDGEAAIDGTKITMSRLAEYLSRQAGRPVIDNTGLRGEYDFRVEFSAEQTAGTSGPLIFTAMQEQLGLKLEPSKAPVTTVVIDHVEKPSAN